MIDVLKQQLAASLTEEEKLNRLREYLQLTALKILDDLNAFDQLAFVGGTALRILFDLKRFSEDLDFSVIQNKGYDFVGLVSGLARGFTQYGLPVEARPKTESNVHSSLIKFSGLLKELGLSAHKEQKLSIKLEVDSRPPTGWKLASTVVNKAYLMNIVHFDLPSSFATKLHACFYRGFTKGRDYYDLLWYLTKKIRPNIILLNNAIKQTQKISSQITDENFPEFLLEHLAKVDFSKVQADVGRFLEDPKELKLLNAKVLKNTVASWRNILD